MNAWTFQGLGAHCNISYSIDYDHGLGDDPSFPRNYPKAEKLVGLRI